MRIPPSVADAMLAQAEAERPYEACGLLGGEAGRAHTFYPCVNQAKSPVFFAIDPAEILKTLRKMEGRGEALVGIFHSHPATRAFPSDADVLHHHYPGTLFLILSLAGGKTEFRAFEIEGGQIRERTVEITED